MHQSNTIDVHTVFHTQVMLLPHGHMYAHKHTFTSQLSLKLYAFSNIYNFFQVNTSTLTIYYINTLMLRTKQSFISHNQLTKWFYKKNLGFNYILQ